MLRHILITKRLNVCVKASGVNPTAVKWAGDGKKLCCVLLSTSFFFKEYDVNNKDCIANMSPFYEIRVSFVFKNRQCFQKTLVSHDESQVDSV